MASAAADALFLSELAFQGGIGRAISTGSLDAPAVELHSFLRSRVAFDRVALLDAQGMERLRGRDGASSCSVSRLLPSSIA